MFHTKYTLTIQKSHTNTLGDVVKKTFNKGDAGIDIYIPEDITVQPKSQRKINLGIHASVRKNTRIKFPGGEEFVTMEPSSYMLFPRSSISKTPLRLSNSIGLIDAGYRGELLAVVDNISSEKYKIKKGDRLFQIVNKDLVPFEEILTTDKLDETDRGDGGFGSTGK
jgi:dUTP pyrophosphatase